MRRRKSNTGKIITAILIPVVIVAGIFGGALAATLVGADVSIFDFSSDDVSSLALADSSPASSLPAVSSDPAQSQSQSDASTQPQSGYTALALPSEMNAMWISFLEWQSVDFSSEDAFRIEVGTMFENCKNMGINTIIAAVRPFGDALYSSTIFPYSHIISGTQGQDPGFDPLTVMVEEAHNRGLRLEAWINPYRVAHPTNGPDVLSADNPASLNPTWVREVGGQMWYDPGVAEVNELIVDGVEEIIQNYEVDGIHFDDYFYPESADETFDADTFAAAGDASQDLAAWRRENINTMMQAVYTAVKATNPSVSFGVSVQGNNDNNYNMMYADVNEWMSNNGYTDYVMPQLYWGFNYLTQSGRDDYAFANISAEWASYPRQENIYLYAGLAAYRIGELQSDGSRAGFGDGGSNDQSEWESGSNLADMVTHLRTVEGFSGMALFRYDHLYQENDNLSASEVAALSGVLQ